MNNFKYSLLSVLLLSSLSFAAPQGFSQSDQSLANAPKGFEQDLVTSVKDIKSNATDNQLVTVRGRLTKALSHDKYLFTDTKGDVIEVELDDDYDWSHIRKDQLIDITGEVDKDFMSITIDVKKAVAASE